MRLEQKRGDAGARRRSSAQCGDLQAISHLRARSIQCVRRQFENARRFEGIFRDSEWSQMLFDPDHLILFAEKYEVDREHHADGVHASGRFDPQTGSEACPTSGFSHQSNESRQVFVREFCVSGHESFPRVVVHVEGVLSEGDVCGVHMIAEQMFRSSPFLIHGLLAAAINDESNCDQSQRACDDPNQSYGLHDFSPFCFEWAPSRANLPREALLVASPENGS
jgi:hypothetical protein